MHMMANGRIRPLWPLLLSILLALLVSGCSDSNENSGLSLVDEQGNHPANFISIHPGFAVADINQCMPCHGDDLTGGISNQSCFLSACHHDPEPNWVVFPSGPPQGHGTSAKQAPGSSGFVSCQICHADDFSGGGAGVSCFLCHTPPHPNSWRSFNVYKHTDTDTGNAPVCAECHADGANSPIPPPSPPAPAGTSPGCFNSTLCHGADTTPHVLGSTWTVPNPSFHGLTAKQDLSFCQTCHGTPGTILFDGGVAPTACSACHPAADAHPTTWFEAPQTGFPPYTPSHRNAGSITTACAICHVVDGPGTGPNPAAPSCFSASFTNADNVAASCHASGPGQAPHAVPFLNHTGVTDATFNHAVTGTSPVAAAPLCTTCHTGGSPLTLMNCTSCHAEPPDGPTATAPYPNKSGAHGKHLGLDSVGTPVSCDTCHTGLGSGNQAHYDRAKAQLPPGDVAFEATYDAQSGPPSFDNAALTCTNVSCHGGQETPDWQAGTLDVNTQCTSCHAFGTTQFNSYNSGEHDRHVNTLGFFCTVCHNTTTLAVNHHTALSTPALEGPASATVGGGTTSVSSYIAPTCISVCHPSPGETW
jgi:predicted CxxxxCH...CXXCH cytochrome family protein